ncbi:MAG: hypothetical protein A2V86_17205 [Deltaproteobacteria bacterium RBG_16_49_23]|nr:MAG: hypothetical protein A2V86_17205 [Deltaproteobacteria bacterium RBG_16_49_23]
MHTRRNFLKQAGKIAIAAAAGGLFFPGCANLHKGAPGLDETLKTGRYKALTRDWDPIYGPPIKWSPRYGGLSHFQGHIQGSAVTPGVDYDVPIGTPLVPMTASYFRQHTKDEHESLYILLVDIFHPGYRIVFGHLDRALVDETFHLSGEVMKYLGGGVRPLRRGEIVALSGNSGLGPIEYRWAQTPHLHISLYYLNSNSRTMAYLDPEKYGLDGGRPVFWDGETALDGEVEKRISKLELTLKNFKQETDSWPKTGDFFELSGQLMEHYHLLGKAEGKTILDSKPFHDLRGLLKRVVLEEKRFLPGTRPYSLMMKIVGYSTDERQEIILTLPFIGTGLEKVYKKPVYEEGPFYHLTPTQKLKP